MRVNDENYRTIWLDDSGVAICIIDQTELPHRFVVRKLSKIEHAADAIKNMQVRGAPLIGVTAAFGMYLAMLRDSSNRGIESAYELLLSTRPTAVNLRWALDQMKDKLLLTTEEQRIDVARYNASQLSDEDFSKIKKVANLFYENEGKKIVIVGHASSRTNHDMDLTKHALVNFNISLERARKVMREFSTIGLNSQKIELVAMSDAKPLYEEIMPRLEAANRRAEIFIQY